MPPTHPRRRPNLPPSPAFLTLLAGLALALPLALPRAAAPQAPATVPSPAPTQSPAHLALLYDGGAVTVLTHEQLAGELAGESVSGLRHIWMWSRELAPRRLSAEDLGLRPGASAETRAAAVGEAVEAALEKARGPGATDSGTLGIRLAAPPDGFPPGAVLYAAPAAMWIEVPETALPTWPIPEDGRLALPRNPRRPWRLRLVGPGLGTPWIEVAPGRSSVELFPQPAETGRFTVVGEADEPLPGTYVQLAERAVGRSRPQKLALYVSGEDGAVEIPAFAGDEAVALHLSEPSHTPRVWTGQPADLPRQLRLSAGATISGRFTDPRGRPLPGVRVRLDGWLADDATVLFLEIAESGEDGRWKVPQVPRRNLALTTYAEGYAALQLPLEVEGKALDLGDLVLTPGVDLTLAVTDDTGAPIPGAEIDYGAGRSAATDGRGLTVLRNLAPGGRLEGRAAAPRHLPSELRLAPPFPEQARLVLPRALTVTGRFTAAEGRSLPEAALRVETGNRFHTEELTGGGFELDLPPEEASRLVFSSPETASLTVPVAPGAPGEVRDLGDLEAPPGLVAAGRVVSAEDQAPVAGARIWLPRPSPQGLLVAWVEGDTIRTTSGAEGEFELRGLPAMPVRLRIDAPGFARGYRQVEPRPEEGRIELGEVAVTRGVTLEVEAGDEVPEGAWAQVDPLGEGLEMDLLTAPLADGAARIRRVPPGAATLSVRTERRMLCEKEITAPAAAETAAVECLVRRVEVRGQVLVGGAPPAAGTLMWSTAGRSRHAGLIYDRLSPGAVRQQQTYGPAASNVAVAVDAAGTFASRDLSPGTWQVTWLPEGRRGAGGEPREVLVPEAAEHTVVLDYPGGTLQGVVVDADGEPVPAARVRQIGGGGLALSDADGRFELSGLSPGLHRLQARQEDRHSPIQAVEIVAGESPEPVRLELEKEAAGRLRITMLGPSGEPAAGGFVFVEADGQASRMLTTDFRGEAEASFPPPYPPRLRVAAYLGGSWSLQPWLDWEQSRSGVVCAPGETGTGGLLLTSEEAQGAVAIEGPNGWDISRLLARLGARPALAPDRPLRLTGLPQGGYRVTVGPAQAQATIAEGETQSLELR